MRGSSGLSHVGPVQRTQGHQGREPLGKRSACQGRLSVVWANRTLQPGERKASAMLGFWYLLHLIFTGTLCGGTPFFLLHGGDRLREVSLASYYLAFINRESRIKN